MGRSCHPSGGDSGSRREEDPGKVQVDSGAYQKLRGSVGFELF